MRLYFDISPANRIVPWNYQQKLVGTFYKWLGENTLHDGLSLYSLSWLSGGKGVERGLSFENGAKWFIGSPDRGLLKKIMQGVQRDPRIAFGMRVKELMLKETPNFPSTSKFFVASPVLVKRTIEDNTIHYGFDDDGVDQLLTETLKYKLRKANLGEEDISVTFDRTYHKARRRVIVYKAIENKVNVCPVILKGSPKAIGFAWDVGIGNSTGIGFGALK